ncbi:MAG: YcaO-like protein with predicted kinase domain [Gammaproteobacteria bacterium]|jgi:YcaO-like protein with predicted kinase domain
MAQMGRTGPTEARVQHHQDSMRDPSAMLEELLAPSPKIGTGSSRRAELPEKTLARLSVCLADFGITRVANITGLDNIGIPVVSVIRPQSRSVVVSQGKGTTLDAAKVSGIMESVELFHAERIIQPLQYASFNDLQEAEIIADITRLPQSATGSFHSDSDLLWIRGTDLLARTTTVVPFELVHTRFVEPRTPGSGAFPATTNGLASGTTLTEAVLHGVCEVIERDARALWARASDEVRGHTVINCQSVADPVAQSLLTSYATANIDVTVWELTTDIGVPVFVCRIESRDTEDTFGGVSGAGCNPDKNIALVRALTEAAQVRLALIAGARDDIGRIQYGGRRDEKRRSFIPVPVHTGRDFADLISFAGSTTNDDVDWVLSRLRSTGFDSVIGVDLSRNWPGIHVVRIIIPGLEGMHGGADYVPGPRAKELIR